MGDETTDQVIQRYEYKAVRSAVATLPDSDQEILALRYGANLNSVEIGHILGMSDGNVRVRLQRAREKLATELGELL